MPSRCPAAQGGQCGVLRLQKLCQHGENKSTHNEMHDHPLVDRVLTTISTFCETAKKFSAGRVRLTIIVHLVTIRHLGLQLNNCST